MHVFMLYQLVRDRQEELAGDASAQRARRSQHALKAAEADERLVWQEWRVLLHALRAR